MTNRNTIDVSEKLQEFQRILVCPLDWGLGHASRCVPIMAALLDDGKEVEVASSGAALQLLKQHFPDLTFHTLPAYRIRYPSRFAILNFLFILPRLLRAVVGEHRQLRKILQGASFDLVISDNRLGCWSGDVRSVFLTHQLRFAFRQKWMSDLAARMHAFWYRRFREIWVPDFPPPNNLAGNLAIPIGRDQVIYIGPLSQLAFRQKNIQYQAVAILSGPEPQRRFLEREILEQFSRLPGNFLLVRGLPEGSNMIEVPENIRIIPFAGAEDLSDIIAQSDMVICRAGYSSIMDLHLLGKKALLIPTPGQPEQEYLAQYHMDKGQFSIQKQGGLNIGKVI